MNRHFTQAALLSLMPLALVVAGCSDADDASSDPFVGTWQMVIEDMSDEPITVYLTPDEEVYLRLDIVEESELLSVAYKLPLTKVSDDWEVPEDIRIIDMAAEMEAQGNRARQSEGVTYIGAMNRAQQAYRLENSEFSSALEGLGLGFQDETEDYSFSITSADEFQAVQVAQAKGDLPNYVGIVAVVDNMPNAIICMSDAPVEAIPPIPDRSSASDPAPECPSGFSQQ